MNKDNSPKLQHLKYLPVEYLLFAYIKVDLLVHPDLHRAGGVPCDQIVAGDDLVGAIVVLAGLVLGRHHAQFQISSLTIILTQRLL